MNFTVITENGNRLYFGDSRYEADKALNASNEAAGLFKEDSDHTLHELSNNHDVFPLLEQEETVSTWIPVTSRLPDYLPDGSIGDCLFTDGTGIYVGFYAPNLEEWWAYLKKECDLVDNITHWTTLPTLP